MVVVAGIQVETVADKRNGFNYSRDISARFLNAGNVRVVGERGICGRFDIDAGTGRNIIEYQRLGARVCNGFEGFTKPACVAVLIGVTTDIASRRLRKACL